MSEYNIDISLLSRRGFGGTGVRLLGTTCPEAGRAFTSHAALWLEHAGRYWGGEFIPVELGSSWRTTAGRACWRGIGRRPWGPDFNHKPQGRAGLGGRLAGARE